MPKAALDGIRINYLDFGNGEPALLFLPGWCSNRTVFQPLISRCRAFCRTLALDWRGHGESGPALGEFGNEELVKDALTVIHASGAKKVIPVALAHAGWVAIELRRRLPSKIPKLVFLDWLVLGAPPSLIDLLIKLQSPTAWLEALEKILSAWVQGVNNLELKRFVREEMGSYGFEMWARAAREIHRAYRIAGSPLHQLALLEPHPPALHLYAQPDSWGFLAAQQEFALMNSWFHVQKLDAKSHFPMFEVPEVISSAIEGFIANELHSRVPDVRSLIGKTLPARNNPWGLMET